MVVGSEDRGFPYASSVMAAIIALRRLFSTSDDQLVSSPGKNKLFYVFQSSSINSIIGCLRRHHALIESHTHSAVSAFNAPHTCADTSVEKQGRPPNRRETNFVPRKDFDEIIIPRTTFQVLIVLNNAKRWPAVFSSTHNSYHSTTACMCYLRLFCVCVEAAVATSCNILGKSRGIVEPLLQRH